jgi:hypothetical protein
LIGHHGEAAHLARIDHRARFGQRHRRDLHAAGDEVEKPGAAPPTDPGHARRIDLQVLQHACDRQMPDAAWPCPTP